MKWIKLLSVGLLVAVMLSTVNSCGGVPDPIVPVATAVPADGSTIKNSDSIVITFSIPMNPSSLTLSGDMASQSAGGVWSKAIQTNDTLTISPSIAIGGKWTTGLHTLIVDVLSASGGPISTLVLNYTIEPEVPTADVVVPANNSTIIGSDQIVIGFSVPMDPSTLVLSGGMVDESQDANWSITNDTLVFRPKTAWAADANPLVTPLVPITLVIDVDSGEGVPLPTLTLNYSVDVTQPTAVASPESPSAINASGPIVIGFSIAMNRDTLVLGGTLASESDSGWTTDSDPDDTLTIRPSISNVVWAGGDYTLTIDVDASNGIALNKLSLNYFVDDANPTIASVTPAGDYITGQETITIIFDEPVDINTLSASGSLYDSSNHVWSSTTTNSNEAFDILTFSPVTTWPGTIDLTVDIVDLVGNSLTPLSLNYTVDDEAPIINLSGDNPYIIAQGSIYTDPGATVTDNVDTGLVAVITGTVNTALVGDYIVIYNVSDTAGITGNAAAPKARTVSVVDLSVPVITLTGADPFIIAQGNTYTEPGATVTDNVDGDAVITAAIVINSTAVNTALVGDYSVTYNVTDTAGNQAVQVTRTVSVVDGSVPVINLMGANPMTVALGGSYVEPGATATDNVDSAAVITAAIDIDSSAVDTTTLGSYDVTYNVTDTAGNPAEQVTRTVSVVDGTAPVVTAPANITVAATDASGTAASNAAIVTFLNGATATDNVDTTLAITTNEPGTFPVGVTTVTFSATDSGSNTGTATATVTVTDQTAPVITLVLPNPFIINQFDTYLDPGASATDNVDSNAVITAAIVINSTAVNTALVGDYTVTYNVSDTAGNPATTKTRTVSVVDAVAPVITLTGANPLIINQGSTYSEPGATATDNVDSAAAITAAIVINSTAVNTALVGDYTVTYNVSDTTGNPATTKTRTVRVIDATAPVVTAPANITVAATDANGTLATDSAIVAFLAGATATDNVDGNVTSNITNNNVLGTFPVGVTPVTFSVIDSSNNTGTATATVSVVDSGAPVITLLGLNPMTVALGGSYVEPGATVSDNVDTGLVAVITGTVNPLVLGDYLVMYNVSDTAGNPAVQVTRTVSVQ